MCLRLPSHPADHQLPENQVLHKLTKFERV